MDTATTTLNLPPELWCKIFEDVDTDALPNISLTCRNLHSIVQPFVFRIFNLYHGDDVSRSDSDNFARLDYYASDAIAPHVRELSISIEYYFHRPNSTEMATSFFDALPRFLNTRSLEIRAIDMTARFLQQVSALPSLEKFRITDCPPPLHPDELPMLRLRTFTCLYYTGQRTNQLGPHRWLALLDPDYLQVLDIPLTSTTCSFFLARDNLSPHPFPSLHTVALKCYGNYGSLPQLPMLLSKFPALRSLEPTLGHFSPGHVIECIRTVERLAPPDICCVPSLEKYTGPHELLPVVLGGAVQSSSTPLRRLILKSIPIMGHPLDAFVNTLKSCHPLQLRGLTHLCISLPSSMDFNSLTPLQDMFPVLQELDIHASISYHTAGPVYNIVLEDLCALPLPRSMVSLSIQWSSPQATTDLPNLVAVKDSLLPRLPSLCRLWLCDGSKLVLLWSRTASGTRTDQFEVGSFDNNRAAWRLRVAVFQEDQENSEYKTTMNRRQAPQLVWMT